MKMNSSYATHTSNEDAEFLKNAPRSSRIADVLRLTPNRLLNSSLDEVDFPVRFVARVKEENVNTLADLLRIDLDSLKGRNLGERTLEVARESLMKFVIKKINQKPLITLRDMMQDFGNDLLAREARIWEMRMGLLSERHTLESVGTKFGLTRERVRQIELALFNLFSKRYPSVKVIQEAVKEGVSLSDMVKLTGELLAFNDPVPLVGILEMLEPKYYLVSENGIEPIISTSPQTEIDVAFKRSLNIAEKIFRNSETLMDRVGIYQALENSNMDNTSRLLAIAKLNSEGIWDGDMLFSPNRDKTNVAIGCLQASPSPVHLDQLVEDVRSFINEDMTPEALRSSLSLIPSVRFYGYGTVGFARHIGESVSTKKAETIREVVEGIISRGPEGFQWNAKDLLAKIKGKLNLNVGHHELNVILQDSNKLAYLGRLTWVLKGETEKRKLYREIFVSVLTKAGKPLPENMLVERAQKQRGLHLNVHLRNDSELLEVQPKVWGLTRRDNPFSKAELAKLTKAFDATFESEHEFTDEYLDNKKIDRKGIRASEIMKVIELKGE